MIRVFVLGDIVHARRIARTLNRARGEVRARFVPSAGYPFLALGGPRTGPVVLIRAGYRVGGTTPLGRLFDAYWRVLRRALPDAAACHYWLGTDVMNTVREVEERTIRRGVLEAARDDLHLTVAPWLTTELGSIGIHATTALLPPQHPSPVDPPPIPAEFRVLTYLPVVRFDFYGGHAILEAARRLHDVRFDVVGRNGAATDVEAPPNVHWHGWVPDLAPFYAASSVLVRIPHHDGFGNTVIEALSRGRHVVYTHQLPSVERVPPDDPDALVDALARLRDAHAAGTFGLNEAGRAWALETFDPDALSRRLLELLRARLDAPAGRPSR